ncbi:hypothetical protein HYH02_008222 [Chlamydomonas schloesseri]|uniref:Protein kinase domain-containing protein n=1 Tax=Chlamydomonas schloesseri TaxID=2026947 RepID=A0A835WFW2_9CHLO|nr:hypothetical protein HYH02_008222 [Chlamydomonas schloesseri]|eukprot:KAG2446651.1 hypothetical protein HYH02_008222 [Chlamydomonas schloesseri]
MVVSIASGTTLRFTGLELVNMFGLVGSQLPVIRQSPGGRVEFVDCVKRRRVGLPTDAALVNMLSAARGGGVPGPQQVYKLSNYTFNTTRSPGTPVRMSNDAVLQLDYVVNVASDSSLAFQGLYFGGYVYVVNNSVYYPDYVVSQSCLDSRPGDECIAAYIQKLDQEAAAAAQAAAAPSDSGLSTTDTIVVAVVVPVGVVLLAAAGTAVLLTRRRRAARRAAAYGKGSSENGNGAGSGESKAARAGTGSVHRSSDIFMGFEPDAPPPVWTVEHEEEAAADFTTRAHEDDADSLDAAPGAMPARKGDAQAGTGMGGTDADAEAAAAAGGLSGPPARQASGRISRSHTGGLRPAFAAGQWGPNRPTGDQAGMVSASSAAPASGVPATPASGAASHRRDGNSAGYVRGGGAANGNGSHAAHEQEQQGLQHVATEVHGAQSQSNGGTPGTGDSVTVQPAEAPRPTDVAAELARMAREVRMQVKDVAIRIDTVLGTGAFGVVYGGIWQGIPVAVKTVVISASAERRKRALQEAALCQSIVHPNIIATYACELQPIGAPIASVASSEAATTDSGRTGFASIMPQIVDWRLYIIQELADGGPLSKLYGSPDIWPAPSAPKMVPVVALGLGIARAVAHLHSKRIIHGDLSPNNVMLKKDVAEPSGFAAKVGDFGLSVMLPQNQSHLSNLRMGTMFYMCPAVILKGQVGPASDVFSLGVILWELFHGRRAGVRTKEGPRYASTFPAFPPNCPRAYVNITLNCLQRQPVNRPASEVVAEHLDALLKALLAESS